MKKKRFSVPSVILALCVMQTSCEAVIQDSKESPRLKLCITGNGDTRSSISPDEDLIKDICIMAYRQNNGNLAAMQTGKSEEDIDLELTAGTYNIYVTANMGTFDAPANETDIAQACHRIGSFSDMDDALPMCWKGTAQLKAGRSTTVHANLSRLVSRIGLNVEMGVLEGLEITSARICQGAGLLRPFMEEGSRMLSVEEAIDSDYASDEDIRMLMDGESICFYVAENCQGTLLPDNTDPWEKIPESIGDRAELCTYMELTGRWNDSADYEGSVIYRFYLGEDAAGNFDIRRNSLHNLTLYLEEDSFDRLSWKIDASQMDILRWDMSSSLDGNFHDRENFYITENIRIDFRFDDNGTRYWSKRNNEFRVEGIGNYGKTVIRFDDPVDIGNGRFYAMGTCVSDGYYDIILTDSKTGETKYILEYGTVHIPSVTVGHKGIYTDDPVERFDEESELSINGQHTDICLYLTDKDGLNLNQSAYYGCDFSICEWDLDLLNKDPEISLYEKASIEVFQGETGSDSYAVMIRLGISNDGRDESWNRRLTKSLGRGMLTLSYEDNNSGAAGKHRMGLYCDDIGITVKPVPDAYKSVMGTEFMYVTDNPSNLPFKIRGLKLNSMNKEPYRADIRPILCNPIPGHTCEDPLLISPMPYTFCSLEEGVSGSVTINRQKCFAADENGTDQTDIPAQWSMFHAFEAGLMHEGGEWSPKFHGGMDLYDSYTHSIMYGEDGYMNCGMVLHDSFSTVEAFDNYNGRRTDFREYGDLLERDYIEKLQEPVELDISINDRNEITATASRTAELKISVSGSLKGHIRCVTIQDPFFTIWGKYYSHSQDFSHSSTFTVGKTPVAIDGSALAGSFEEMRAIPYYSALDVWDEKNFREPYSMIGTVREYLKPYDIDLNIEITSPEDTPVAVRFTGSATYDYKISSPVTWSTGLFSSVTMVPSSYSGFDDRLDDDDCPVGALFKADLLYLQPNVTYGNARNIYYVVQ